tara:strand:- start:3486 stop:4124 length:639 start_codon:yes stop_codon:yes gene_type:complete
MTKVAIIDYDCGNIFSLANALYKINQPFEVISDASTLNQFDHAILPGVGSFGPAISHLKDMGFDNELREFAQKGKTIFGICLGMQLMLSKSHENGTHQGIGLIEGSVERIQPKSSSQRVPNIGWSNIIINPVNKTGQLFSDNTNKQAQYYFIHSYQAIPRNPADVTARIEYSGSELTAAVGKEYVHGVQFHPEKSGPDGLKLFNLIQRKFWT